MNSVIMNRKYILLLSFIFLISPNSIGSENYSTPDQVPRKIYLGYKADVQEAFDQTCASIKKHMTTAYEIKKVDWESLKPALSQFNFLLKDNFPLKSDGILRFTIPHLEDFQDTWVLYADGINSLVIGDLEELFKASEDPLNKDKSIIVYKRSRQVNNAEETFAWSSIMLINPKNCKNLTISHIKEITKDDVKEDKENGIQEDLKGYESLHRFDWLDDKENSIGFFPSNMVASIQIHFIDVSGNVLPREKKQVFFDDYEFGKTKIIHSTHTYLQTGWVDFLKEKNSEFSTIYLNEVTSRS